MGNATSNSSNQTKPFYETPTLSAFRPPQKKEAVRVQMFTAIGMNALIIILSIIMIIIFHQRLRSSIPYLMLQNIFVLDLFTAITPGMIWSVLLLLDFFGIAIDFICRAVGFLHSFMYNAFLLNIAVISLSQFLLYTSPALHGKIFANCIVTRIILLAVWSVGGLLSTAPLNPEGGWGMYDMFESTCWVKWVNTFDLSYNIITVLLTVGPALAFTILSVVFLIKERGKQTSNRPGPQKDIILIAAIQMVIFFILFLALTIMNVKWNKHWSEVDFKVDLAFLFLFFARGLWNPIVCLAVSENIRTAFVKVIVRCHCKATSVAPLEEGNI